MNDDDDNDDDDDGSGFLDLIISPLEIAAVYLLKLFIYSTYTTQFTPIKFVRFKLRTFKQFY